MIEFLDFEVVRKFDNFLVKEVLSPFYSPQTIAVQQILDYNKHCTIPFGAFVQANNENNTTDSNVLCTINGVYLGSLDKIQGVHEIFYLCSLRVITRRKIIEIKIPKETIKHIEGMAASDKDTSLNICSIPRRPLFYRHSHLSALQNCAFF